MQHAVHPGHVVVTGDSMLQQAVDHLVVDSQLVTDRGGPEPDLPAGVFVVVGGCAA